MLVWPRGTRGARERRRSASPAKTPNPLPVPGILGPQKCSQSARLTLQNRALNIKPDRTYRYVHVRRSEGPSNVTTLNPIGPIGTAMSGGPRGRLMLTPKPSLAAPQNRHVLPGLIRCPETSGDRSHAWDSSRHMIREIYIRSYSY